MQNHDCHLCIAEFLKLSECRKSRMPSVCTKLWPNDWKLSEVENNINFQESLTQKNREDIARNAFKSRENHQNEILKEKIAKWIIISFWKYVDKNTGNDKIKQETISNLPIASGTSGWTSSGPGCASSKPGCAWPSWNPWRSSWRGLRLKGPADCERRAKV